MVNKAQNRPRNSGSKSEYQPVRWWSVVLEFLPIAAPLGVAVFGAVAVLLLVFGQLRNELVWPLGIAASAVAILMLVRHGRIERPGSLKEQRICDFLVLLIVLVWGIFNVLYTAEHVFTNRDPAVYAVTGAELVESPELSLTTPDVFAGIPGVSSTSAGFAAVPGDKEVIHAQGQHLLPVLLGLGGRIVGEARMLRLNVLFGMTALLALYAFARLLVRPYWALVATIAFALSLPLIYFSRGTYTEPLAAAFTFGGLALLWVAQKNQKLGLWFMAGVFAGAGTLTRIDGYITLLGLSVFLIVFLVLSSTRLLALKQAASLLVAASIVSAIGWLDVVTLSKPYYLAHRDLIMQLMLAIGGTLAIGAVVVAVGWHTALISHLNKLTRKWRGAAAAVVFIIIIITLSSRPLWLESYSTDTNSVVSSAQIANGETVTDRNYNELTVNWLSWYIGIPLTVLGFIGLAYALSRSLKNRGLLLMPAALVISFSALLYLIKPSITPDHIWAIRRFLPVVLPGLVIFSMVAIQSGLKYLPKNTILRGLSAVVLSIVVLLGPLRISYPFWAVRNKMQLSSVNSVCDVVPDNGAILWLGIARLTAVQTTGVFCDVPTAGYSLDGGDQPTKQTLAVIAARAYERDKIPIVGILSPEEAYLVGKPNEKNLTPVSTLTYKQLERTLTKPPRDTVEETQSVLLGVITIDGGIQPLR